MISFGQIVSKDIHPKGKITFFCLFEIFIAHMKVEMKWNVVLYIYSKTEHRLSRSIWIEIYDISENLKIDYFIFNQLFQIRIIDIAIA